eukprot:2006638-Pleurochrysis_carterae.AAC.1
MFCFGQKVIEYIQSVLHVLCSPSVFSHNTESKDAASFPAHLLSPPLLYSYLPPSSTHCYGVGVAAAMRVWRL